MTSRHVGSDALTGRSFDDYHAPLFVAWQLTNRCSARCLACCEESGPDRAWHDELTRDEALSIGRQIVDAGVPYVAFGGGEPLGVEYCLDLLALLAEGGVSLKLETDGSRIDANTATRLTSIGVPCIQISVDGATAATHERVRPGSRFDQAIASIKHLVERGAVPQWVFVPNRLNLHEIVAAYDRAVDLGCSAFVTGPMMRIGRAAAAWDTLACTPLQWQQAVDALREHAAATGNSIELSIYPWDILEEIRVRLHSPQAMLLIVPNGKVKLLNALPFAPADLRKDSLQQAWRAYQAAWRSREVSDFIATCRTQPELLRHANETWELRSEKKVDSWRPEARVDV